MQPPPAKPYPTLACSSGRLSAVDIAPYRIMHDAQDSRKRDNLLSSALGTKQLGQRKLENCSRSPDADNPMQTTFAVRAKATTSRHIHSLLKSDFFHAAFLSLLLALTKISNWSVFGSQILRLLQTPLLSAKSNFETKHQLALPNLIGDEPFTHRNTTNLALLQHTGANSQIVASLFAYSPRL